MNLLEEFKKWKAGFSVYEKLKTPYWVGSGYTGPLAFEKEFIEFGYKLDEKYKVDEITDSYENFYITGRDLYEAFLAGYNLSNTKQLTNETRVRDESRRK